MLNRRLAGQADNPVVEAYRVRSMAEAVSKAVWSLEHARRVR